MRNKLKLKKLIYFVFHYSSNCDSPILAQPAPNDIRRSFYYINPQVQKEMVLKMNQPYMGMHDGKLWDNKGLLGRVMGPIEDTYLGFVQHQSDLPTIHDRIFN